MDPLKEFEEQERAFLAAQRQDVGFRKVTQKAFRRSVPHKCSYGFTGLGLPIIQRPQDVVAIQELGWRIPREFIVEAGIARGAYPDTPRGPRNNPKTAVRDFLRDNDRFVVDSEIEGKLLITVAPSGCLRCVTG